MSPRATRAPALRAAAGPRPSGFAITRAPHVAAIDAVASVERSSTTITSSSPAGACDKAARHRAIVDSPLCTGTIALTRGAPPESGICERHSLMEIDATRDDSDRGERERRFAQHHRRRAAGEAVTVGEDEVERQRRGGADGNRDRVEARLS